MISIVFFVLSSIVLGCSNCASVKTDEAAGEKSSEPKSPKSLMAGLQEIVDDLRFHLGSDKIPEMDSFDDFLKHEAALIKNSLSSDKSGLELVDRYIDVIYGKWGIAFDPNRDDLLSLLPHTIIQRKRGSCLGVSMLLLLMAEQNNMPLYGVILPGHFFVRYQDSLVRRNIEPNLRGYPHSNAYYREQYQVDTNSWYNMQNLSNSQSLAAFCYNIGGILRISKRYPEAVAYYQKTVENLDGFAEAWGNLAITYATLKMTEKARKSFEYTASLHPGLQNLAKNQGAFELQHGEISKAIDVYRRGLRHYPGNAHLLYGLAFAFYKQKAFDSAKVILKKIDKNSSIYPKALQLQTSLTSLSLQKKPEWNN